MWCFMSKTDSPSTSGAVVASSGAERAAHTTWHMALTYDGSQYYGFQIQPGLPTVHAELEQRLQKLFRRPELRIKPSSRTDGGVHALDQHISFVTPASDMPGESLTNILNRWLPMDIRVKWSRPVAPEFQARKQATAKSYVYALYPGRRLPPFLADYCWHLRSSVNMVNMQRAAEGMQGEHDFSSFAVSRNKPVSSCRRTLYRVEVIRGGAGQIFVHVLGDNFLYKMVRSIAGHLVNAGHQQTWTPEDTEKVLAARDRSVVGTTAPAKGLFLAKVFFDHATRRNFVPPVPPMDGLMTS